ncbi:MAG TPA: ATP-binding protein [Acidobacteriaceae bacterium]|nr:ATP-binding protein [Acidobacteriaceae bacterium]
MSKSVGARLALGINLAIDVLALTAVLALAGGPANPLSLLYLVQITLSAVVLSRGWTWSLGVLSIAGYGFLFMLHVRIPMLEGRHPAAPYSVHLAGMWIAFVAAATLITIFVSKVSQILRSHEQEVLRLQDLVGRQETVASIATLAAAAAHGMGTPLATIAVVARELEKHAAEVHLDQHVAAEARLIRSEVDRCGRILRQMGSQGAECAGETPTHVDLQELIDELRDSFSESERRLIQTEVDSGVTVTLPVETTRQVLAALLRNAIDASTENQVVRLNGSVHQGVLRFAVTDSGTGMPPELLGRIAEPFFTTKGAERGMGLGTFLVRTFAENLGGSLVFDSAAGQGTTAVLELPFAGR